MHDDTTIMSRKSVMVQLLSYLQSQYTFTFNLNKYSIAFFSSKLIPPFPLNLNDSLVYFGRWVKNMGVYLDSIFTLRMHVEYNVCKFSKNKNNLADLLYSDAMNMANKLMLYKTVLSPSLLYCAHIGLMRQIPTSKKSRLSRINF